MNKSDKQKLAVAKILASFPNTPRRFDTPSGSFAKMENPDKSMRKKTPSPPKTKNIKKKAAMNKVENTNKVKKEKQKRATRAKGAKGAKDASGVQNNEILQGSSLSNQVKSPGLTRAGKRQYNLKKPHTVVSGSDNNTSALQSAKLDLEQTPKEPPQLTPMEKSLRNCPEMPRPSFRKSVKNLLKRGGPILKSNPVVHQKCCDNHVGSFNGFPSISGRNTEAFKSNSFGQRGGFRRQYNRQPPRRMSLNEEAMPTPSENLESQGLLERLLRRPEEIGRNYIKQAFMVTDFEHDSLVLTQEEMELRKVVEPILGPISNPDFKEFYKKQILLFNKPRLCAGDQKENTSFLPDDQMEKIFISSEGIHTPPTLSSPAVSVYSDSDDMCEDFLGFSSDE